MKTSILFVDDDTKVLQAFERMCYPLRTEWEMVFVDHASKALTLLGQGPCDVIVSDMRMPDIDGAELLARVQRNYPSTARIALTGYAYLDSAVRAINEGHIFRFLTKPCSIGTLILTIQAALQHQEQEKQRTLSHLLGVGKRILSSFTPQVLLKRLCQLTTKVLECDYSYTFLWQPEQDAYAFVSGHGDPPEQREMRRALKVPRAGARELLARLKREDVVQMASLASPLAPPALLSLPDDMNACLYVALREHGKIIGLHTAGYRDRGRSFTFQQECFARWMSQLASLALENARLASQLADATQVKEEFLSTISHELRTPLHILMGYNDLLLDQAFGPLMDEQLRVLQRMAKSSDALFDLISSLLEMNRLQTGELSLELEEMYFPKFFREFRAEIQNLWEKPNLNFRWSVAPNLPLVCTDPGKLRVILKNLLSNAVKFTDSGSVDVQVSPSKGGVDITVADTGIGIAPEILPFLFEPFRQGDGSTTRRYKGVGSGLYIVKRLLELLGGTITVDSQLGRGTLVHVWIPTASEVEACSPAVSLNGH